MDLPEIIQLRPRHNLVNPNFDGYKLSLDPIPILKLELAASPRRVFTDEDQYSFLHAKLFSLHNHLFRDPWLPYSSYFIDDNWTIQNIRYDDTAGQIQPIRSVFKIGKPPAGAGDYNPSLVFVSEKYCAFSDGCGGLKIIDTGDRYRSEEWKGVFSEVIFDDSSRFLIQDARLEIRDGIRQIHCLLVSVQKAGDSGFESVIHWFFIEKDANENKWKKTQVKQLKGKSLPDYCVLEPKSDGILLSSDHAFKFVTDSENPVLESVESGNNKSDDEKALENGSKFTWKQTDEDVIIQFNINQDFNKSDIKVICTGRKINVSYMNQNLLDAELYGNIDNDLTTWNLENELLQVTLVKGEVNQDWGSLLGNDIHIPPTEEQSDNNKRNGVADPMAQPPTSTLCSEMEECDFGDGLTQSEYFIERIDGKSHKTTHKVNLGSNNPPLFTIPLRAGQPSAFALRSDVDVFLWLPQITLNLSDNQNYKLSFEHEGTLNAFGYVQASKQERKYIQCSQDMSYAVICEPRRHLFIYKMTYSSAAGLKNRSSGLRACIGQQKLATMDENDEVLGILCETEVIILLTRTHVICYQINA